MSSNVFKLTSREEVLTFELMLRQYVGQEHLPLIPLTRAYDRLQERNDGGRIFTALFDIGVNFALLFRDVQDVATIKIDNEDMLESGSLLNSISTFQAKMEIHRNYSSYIYRYRALWDKIMGFIILMFSPNDYGSFWGAKSRRKSFAKISSLIPQVDQTFIEYIDSILTKFNNTFRTPEAHGTGSLRKWSFLMEPIHQNPQIELLYYWNAMLEVIIKIGDLFDSDEIDSFRLSV